MCSLTAKIAKLVLFTLNFAVWVCGAAIMGVGIALVVDEDALGWLEVSSDIQALLVSAAGIMIAVGVLLFLVGFLGCCGVCKGNRCMLQTYIILVSILLVLELVGAILAIVFKDSLTDDIADSMYSDLRNDYQGVNDTDSLSISWNSMQQSLKCCGTYNYTDYAGSSWAQGASEPVPITCCASAEKGDGFYTISASARSTCMNDAATGGTDELFGDKGCYQGLTEWIQEKSDIIIGVLIGLGAVQLFGLIGACCVKSSLEEGD